VRNGSSDAPCARGDGQAGNNHERGKNISAYVHGPQLFDHYQDQREYDHAMDSHNAVFHYERAKFLVLDLDLPFRTDVNVHLAADCFTVDITERTRVSINRIKLEGLFGRSWRRLPQIEP
jgi:hypothetical protein